MIKIEVLEDIRCFKKGDTFEFTEPTLLVGSNGSGKSTLLRALRGYYGYKFGSDLEIAHSWDTSEQDNKKLAKSFLITTDIKQGVFFDAVLDDPARQTTDAVSLLTSGGYHLNRKSHGEAGFALLDRCIRSRENVENKLVVLDEFDNGFSIDKQIQSKKLLTNLPKLAALVLAVSHSYLVIRFADYKLYCMDTKKFITVEQFTNRVDFMLNQ